MSGTYAPHLEVVEWAPATPNLDVPVLFVHGAYAGAWCWEEHFLPYFAERGIHAYALSLRGHGGSEGRESLQMATLADYVDDVERVVDGMPKRPVLVGHSMGGMVVQKFLERQVDVPGAVLMGSVPPQGLGMATLRLMLRDPVLFWQVSMMHHIDPAFATVDTARRAGFSETMPEVDLERCRKRFGPESTRAIWDMTVSDLVRPWRVRKPPMLVLGGNDDALFPPGMIRATASAYGVRAEILPDMAHVMMLEPGWQRVADRIIDWMADLQRL